MNNAVSANSADKIATQSRMHKPNGKTSPASVLSELADTDILGHALAYAEKGLHVFPIYEIIKGVCACGDANCKSPGKHPRIIKGFKSATTNPDTIKSWWEKWPNANIGIATGEKSEIIVLDVDDGGEETLVDHNLELPETVMQFTGGGGKHYFYKYPSSGGKYKSSVKFLYGLDSRANGGYVVAAPSTHKSGKTYEWEASSGFDDVELAEAPVWLLDATIDTPRNADKDISYVPNWKPEGLPSDIKQMLAVIPSENYDIWVKVGMALNYLDPSDKGRKVWKEWSAKCLDKFYPNEIISKWNGFTKGGHKTTPLLL